MRGDSSIYTDLGGVEHVAIVTREHTDGSVDLAVLKTSLRNIVRSAQPKPGQFFDPNFVEPLPMREPAADDLAKKIPGSVLSSVPLTDAQYAATGGIGGLLQGASSPAGLWPPRNLDPVPGEAEGKIYAGNQEDLKGQLLGTAESVQNPAHGDPADVEQPEEPPVA